MNAAQLVALAIYGGMVVGVCRAFWILSDRRGPRTDRAHRDRQYRDRTEATQHAADDAPNGGSGRVVENIIHAHPSMSGAER